jgi:parallel beta-helix repeat protein
MVLLLVTGGALSFFGSAEQLRFPEGVFLGGNTLYVGGSGPGNYTHIQDAISAANKGDTIYVYSGTYVEHLIMSKSLRLIGENKNTTIIDGNGNGDVIILIADDVSISGFTIQHSGSGVLVDAGIEVYSDGNTIVGNTIAQNGEYGLGVFLNRSSHNTIKNNTLYACGLEGVFLVESNHNLIENNEIFHTGHCSIVLSRSSYNTIVHNDMYENHDAAVSLWPYSTYNEIAWNRMHDLPWSGMGIWEGSNDNVVHHNIILNTTFFGITLLHAQGTVIDQNTISGSEKGITLSFSSFNRITRNNFIEHDCHAQFDNSSRNRWRRNYWDDHQGFHPVRIQGEVYLPWNTSHIIQWNDIDWFPALHPYTF